MLRRTTILALLVSLSIALPAAAGCSLPRPPSKVPDGTTATEPQMVGAMLTLKQYNTDVANYIKCLEFESSQNRISREDQARQHNSAIDGLQQIAAKFNEQVRIFKSRSG